MQNDSDGRTAGAGTTGHAAAKRAEAGRARFHVAAQKDAALAAGGKPDEADAARMVAEFHARGGRVTVCPPADEPPPGGEGDRGETS
ncbi:hypothetical protein [Craurococcus roseus]